MGRDSTVLSPHSTSPFRSLTCDVLSPACKSAALCCCSRCCVRGLMYFSGPENPQNCSLLGGSGSPLNTLFLWPTEVFISNACRSGHLVSTGYRRLSIYFIMGSKLPLSLGGGSGPIQQHLWPSDILILPFLVFNPGDLYYLGYKKIIIIPRQFQYNFNWAHPSPQLHTANGILICSAVLAQFIGEKASAFSSPPC